MTTDSETMEQYLTFAWSRFLISVLVFVSRDYELGTGWHWFSLQMLFQLHSLGGGGVQSRPSVPYGANFYMFALLWVIILNLQFSSCITFEVRFQIEPIGLTGRVIFNEQINDSVLQESKNLWIVWKLINITFANFLKYATSKILNCMTKNILNAYSFRKIYLHFVGRGSEVKHPVFSKRWICHEYQIKSAVDLVRLLQLEWWRITLFSKWLLNSGYW